MSKLCVIHGCSAKLRNKSEGDEIHYFKVLESQLEEWNRVIPGAQVKLHDKICSRHFKDEDIIKDLNFVVDDETVTMSRGKWAVKKGSVPSVFDNYTNDGVRVTRYRKTRPTSFFDHASSSDENEWVEPSEKRPNTGSKQAKKRVTKNSSKSCGNPDEAAEVLWEEACDDFVTQLNSLRSPIKLRPGRPRKYPKTTRRKLPKVENQVHETAPPLHSEKSPSGLDTENSVIIEQFVVSSCEESSYELNKKLASKGCSVDSDEVVILTDPESPVSKDYSAPARVKTEKCDDGYEDCAGHQAHCSVSGLKGSRNSAEWVAVDVKREVCDCDGTDPVCREPVEASEVTILELPASPCEAPPEEPPVEDPRDEPKTQETSVQEVIAAERPTSQPPEVKLEPPEHAHVSCSNQDTSLHTTPQTPNNYPSSTKSSENTDIPHPPKLNDTQDVDFFGFSSGEEEELALKRNFYENSSEMASKSAKLYFDKMNAKQQLEQTVERQPANEEKSTEEMALAQLSKLRVMKPSMRLVSEKQPKAAPKTRAPGRSKKSDPSNKTSPDEEVLKNDQTSDNVTATKLSTPLEQPDQSTPNTTLDKIPTPSTIKLDPSRGSSAVSVPTSTPPLMGRGRAGPGPCFLNSSLPFKNTSTNSPKDRILGGPASDKLAHLLHGSSLDRILNSTKTSLMDSVCDPVDKKSLILKNFKSDGVLALEVVVLKEQVRQLQKELFLYKQMLIDSEHNASVLRSRLELQSQLPCTNCMTFKRGFVCKETLI